MTVYLTKPCFLVEGVSFWRFGSAGKVRRQNPYFYRYRGKIGELGAMTGYNNLKLQLKT